MNPAPNPRIARFRGPALVVAVIAMLVPALHPRSSAAAVRGTLTIHGRVADSTGTPVPNAWIYSKGSRRVSTLADADGDYVLEIPGGTLPELARHPLLLRIQSRARGWRIARPDGSAELGIELSVSSDASGVATLRVRSNDSRVAGALADATVLDGSPVTVLEVDFRAVPEPEVRKEPVDLTVVEEVTLSGVALPQRADALAPPPNVSGPEVIPTGQRAAEKLSQGAAAAASAAASRTPEPEADAGPPPAVSSPAPARTAETEPAADLRAKSKRPAGRETSSDKPKNRKSKREAKSKRDDRSKAREKANPEPPDTDVKPRVVRPALGPSGREPEGGPRVVNPAEEAPAGGDTSATPAASEGPPKVVRPADAGDGYEPPPPPVTQAANEQGEWCTCRVDGFVEVRWADRPLEKLKVRLWIEGHRQVSDEVELFMGSPRAFSLKSVPCGPQRVMFEPRSRQPFELTSPEPRVDCTDGGSRQVRLVLAPAKRKSRKP